MSGVTSSLSTDAKKDKTRLSGVMEHFGLSKSLHVVAYYDAEYHQHVFKDLKAAIPYGQKIEMHQFSGCYRHTTAPPWARPVARNMCSTRAAHA